MPRSSSPEGLVDVCPKEGGLGSKAKQSFGEPFENKHVSV